MANKKITELPDIGTPASGDLLEIVDISEGVSKRVAVSALTSGSTPTLQEVTDEGNETTNSIKVKDSEKSFTLQSNGINFQDIDDGGNTILRFEQTSVVDQEVVVRGLAGTMALTSDIPTLTSELTNNGADGVNPFITALDVTIPTLQEVLDNNHDLVDGNFFVGTLAGDGNSGTYVIGIGDSALRDNTTDYNVAIGSGAGFENTGTGLSGLGVGVGNQNSGDNVVAIGSGAGIFNTYNYVNLFGTNATADENGQTVLSKDGAIMARISTADLTETQKYNLPDASGTVALTSDIPPTITIDATPTDGSSNAVSSNGVFDALALKADLVNVEQIFDAKGYGNWGQANNSTAEEVLRVIDVNGGYYTPTDSMSLLIRLQKGSNTGNMTLRVRAGINGNTSDNLILTTTVAAGGNSQSILMQRNQIVFDASNLYIPNTTQSLNTDITSGAYGTYNDVSLDISNNWKITITCQTDSNTQNIILRHYKITKFKNT